MTALVQSSGSEFSISQKIASAFDILGPVSKQKLFERLRDNYGTEIWSATQEDLHDIKHAIVELFGDHAASLLMDIVYAEIDKV